MKQPAVYLLASGRDGTSYIGVASNLVHACGRTVSIWHPDSPTKANDTLLVYRELHASMEAATTRARQIRKWRRAGKLRLIKAGNPCSLDMWQAMVDA